MSHMALSMLVLGLSLAAEFSLGGEPKQTKRKRLPPSSSWGWQGATVDESGAVLGGGKAH